ncbi:MAG: phosphatidylglycerol lysyltransferase domain-containing protein [Desulfosalsimonadaceae bacterium]
MKLSFHPIELDRQAEYQARLENCPQLCSDYTFANLWSWAEVYGLQWAWTEELVWIRQQEPEMLLWAPVGNWAVQDWSSLRAALPPEFTRFTRVPEKLCEIWEAVFGCRMQAQPERDQFDYLYDARELRDLPGKRFHSKKNLVNQFKKKNSYSYLEMNAEMADRAMALQDDWCTWRLCESSSQLSAENNAIMRTLQNWGVLQKLMGGCIFVEDLIVAYTIGEMLTADTLLIHFEKGCPEYKGAYQAINQLFLQQQPEQRVRQVNREQDAGDEGLKKAKLSYHPVDFLKKYRIHL